LNRAGIDDFEVEIVKAYESNILIMMFYWGEEISRVNFSGGWYKK
jgi:hypothetical protein